MIERWREDIDHLDRVLVRLLNLRARLVLRIARSKRAAGVPVRAPAREREVLRDVVDANPGPLAESAGLAVFRLLIRESRLGERFHPRPPAHGPQTPLAPRPP